MPNTTTDIWTRVGIESEQRLRWLLSFAALDPAQLTNVQRETVGQETRAFLTLQEIDPRLRRKMPSWPPPTDATQDAFTHAEVWRAQDWIKRGLISLQREEKWRFAPRVRYELDSLRGILWLRMKAPSRLEQFKALAYQTFTEARLRLRFCPHCGKAFVPNRGQKYCASSCSQAVRTRKWRKANPERNRAIRRAQYKRAIEAKLNLSQTAAIKITRRHPRNSG
jgi:hypothetical protein